MLVFMQSSSHLRLVLTENLQKLELKPFLTVCLKTPRETEFEFWSELSRIFLRCENSNQANKSL